jgi:hypothetical protein
VRARLRAWWARPDDAWADLALVGVLILVFFTRWWAARTLELPLWDAPHHAMIAQLLVDHGGLFSSWAPYAELRTFTYHFGFHALVSVLHWLSRLPMPEATLWMGQILNGVAVATLYPLGVRMGGNRWGGVLAVLVAGLLSPHPAYYMNWGRYTQLAGQVLLPVAVYLTWTLAEAPAHRRGLAALAALTVGGLALTHYRVLLMYGCFVAALLVLTWRRANRVVGPVAAVAAGALVIALPWMVTSLGTPLLEFARYLLTLAPAQMPRAVRETGSLPDPKAYPAMFWLLAVAGFLGGCLRRWRAVVLLVLWWMLVVISGYPARLGLPGTGIVTGFAVMIAGYMGGALMAAAGAGWLAPARSRLWAPACLVAVLVLALLGTPDRMSALDPHDEDSMPGRPDRRAAAWIDAHLPPHARLLTRAGFGWADTIVVGVDAGVWLPLLAGRAVTTPPVNYTIEAGPRPDYRAWVEALPRTLRARELDDPAVLAMLRDRAVTHVYVRQRRAGAATGDPSIFQPERLLASARFRPVYHQDRVWVFEVVP